jgi:hypothetical protein
MFVHFGFVALLWHKNGNRLQHVIIEIGLVSEKQVLHAN